VLPKWMPLSVFVWAVAMVVYDALGLLFEWLDRKHWLNRFKRRRGDRRGYQLSSSINAASCYPTWLPAKRWAWLYFQWLRHDVHPSTGASKSISA